MNNDQLITLCQRYHALLLHNDEHIISIAVVDTPAPELMEALRSATQKRIDIECWSQEQMNKRQKTASPLSQPASHDIAPDIIGQVNQILEQALDQKASDIHIEPEENHLRIRLRIDGVLHQLSSLPLQLAAPVTARLKVLGHLDIAEHRLPQDGQFTLTLSGRQISFRIATLPCRHGEKLSCVYCSRPNRRWNSKHWV